MKALSLLVLKVLAKVKVFVHTANADADGRAMTLAPRSFVPARCTYKEIDQNIRIVCET